VLWIEFANASIGRQMRAVHKNLYEHRADIRSSYTPIFRLSRPFKATSRQESTVLWWQFPVSPATASTFHHNQGLTLQQGAVNFRGPKFFPKMAGRHYVGYSRFSRPEGHLFVLDSAFEEIYVDPRVHSEMARLRTFSHPERLFTGLKQTSTFPQTIHCVVHNTRSLVAHIDDEGSDRNLMVADLLIFTETQIKSSKGMPNLDLQSFRHAYGETSHATESVNVLVYQKHHQSSFLCETACFVSHSDFTVRYDIFAVPHMSDKIHIISVYRSPHTLSLHPVFQHLQDLLALQQRLWLTDGSPLLVCGDFNIDLLQDSIEARLEVSLFQTVSLYQAVLTHTTNFGSLLDHVWTNIPLSKLDVSLQESFWSDHVPVLITFSF
jgi:exonuclease III